MVKVSAIIPTYNREKLVVKAVASALAQDYSDLEVIVIDDGSTDNTKEALKQFEGRIKYVYQPNSGLSSARIRGFNESNGDYLAFLDSDDMWLANKTTKQVAALDNDPGLAFVFSETYVIDKEDRTVKTWERAGREGLRDLFDICYVWIVTVMIRRSSYEAVNGFDPDLHSCQDYDLFLRLMNRYPYSFMEETLAKYRKHDTNMSLNWELRLKDNILILKKDELRKEFKKCFPWYKRLIRQSKLYYREAQYCFENKSYFKTANYYFKSVLYWPLIGNLFWPEETKKMKFSLPYRFLKPYVMVIISLVRGSING